MRLLHLALVGTLLGQAIPAGAQDGVGGAGAQDGLLLARQRFQAGVALYDRQRYAEALTEFQASQALYASPNTHLYLARCERALGRPVEAMAHYERALALADERAATDPRYRETGDAARDELAPLRKSIALVRVQAPALPVGARVMAGEREIPPAGLGLLVPMNPGHVQVRATAPRHVPFVADLTLAAGELRDVTVTLAPVAAAPVVAPSPPPSGRTAAWVTLAGGGVALAAFGTFYALAAKTHDDLENDCPNGCTTSRDDDVTRGRRYQLLANVSLGVGLGALAVGALLWRLGGRTEADTSTAVSVAFDGQVLTLGRRF